MLTLLPLTDGQLSCVHFFAIMNHTVPNFLGHVALFIRAGASVAQTPRSGTARLPLSILKGSPSGCACLAPAALEERLYFSAVFSAALGVV